MDFSWEELSEEDRRQAYADWEAGKGLIGGDPRQRPGSHLLPAWGINQPFFRALALDDARGDNGAAPGRLARIRPGQLEVEIGYGRGDFLLDRALRHPERLLDRLRDQDQGHAPDAAADRAGAGRRHVMADLWLSDDDARFNLPRVIGDGRVDIFHVLFPDPWWKTQHIGQAALLAAVCGPAGGQAAAGRAAALQERRAGVRGTGALPGRRSRRLWPQRPGAWPSASARLHRRIASTGARCTASRCSPTTSCATRGGGTLRSPPTSGVASLIR